LSLLANRWLRGLTQGAAQEQGRKRKPEEEAAPTPSGQAPKRARKSVSRGGASGALDAMEVEIPTPQPTVDGATTTAPTPGLAALSSAASASMPVAAPKERRVTYQPAAMQRPGTTPGFEQPVPKSEPPPPTNDATALRRPSAAVQRAGGHSSTFERDRSIACAFAFLSLRPS